MKLAKSKRVPGWNRPVRFWTMKTLLVRFGLARSRDNNCRSMLTGHRKNPYALWDEVRSHWRRVRRDLHPDAGGCGKRFAWFSSIHDEIRTRLKRDGVET